MRKNHSIRLFSLVLLLLTGMWWSMAALADNSSTQPTPAAKDACLDKDADDLCTFVNLEGSSIDGACTRGMNEDNGTLYCLPNS